MFGFLSGVLYVNLEGSGRIMVPVPFFINESGLGFKAPFGFPKKAESAVGLWGPKNSW